MANSSKITMSSDEILATLKRTSLPTVLIEGSDDILVFRHLEHAHSSLGLSVLPVGGRTTILELFNRRSELPPNAAVVFIADKDIWVITGIPPQYQHHSLIFTTGYSIENDVFMDGNLLTYLLPDESNIFHSEIERYVRWYALAVTRHTTNPSTNVSLHPEHLLDNQVEMAAQLSLEAGETYPDQMRVRILSDYHNLLRGKTLMKILCRRLGHKKRTARHNEKSLIEVVGLNRGVAINEIFSNVARAFEK